MSIFTPPEFEGLSLEERRKLLEFAKKRNISLKEAKASEELRLKDEIEELEKKETAGLTEKEKFQRKLDKEEEELQKVGLLPNTKKFQRKRWNLDPYGFSEIFGKK